MEIGEFAKNVGYAWMLSMMIGLGIAGVLTLIALIKWLWMVTF